MSVTSWRAILLALCGGAAVINASQNSRTADPAVVRVDAVDAGGAAAASGLRAGDLIPWRDLTPGERYRLLTGVHPHEKL